MSSEGHQVIRIHSKSPHVDEQKANSEPNRFQKSVTFLRHAEGVHNEAARLRGYHEYQSFDWTDARLTDLGKEQCSKAANALCDEMYDLVIVSPLRRTLETATLVYGQRKREIPWVAHESIREQIGFHPCDQRSPVSEMSKQFDHIDFSLLESDHDHLWTMTREDHDSMFARSHKLFDFLRERDEQNILVVSHASFLAHLFNSHFGHESLDDINWAPFQNCEFRQFALEL